MALNAIQSQHLQRMLPLLDDPRAMNEGAAGAAQRIGSIALSVIATLASFVFLPWQGALFLSAAVSAIFLSWGFGWCQNNNGAERPEIALGGAQIGPAIQQLPGAVQMPLVMQRMPWYQRAINWIPFLRRERIEVADPRERERVGQPGPNRVRARDIPAGGAAAMGAILHGMRPVQQHERDIGEFRQQGRGQGPGPFRGRVPPPGGNAPERVEVGHRPHLEERPIGLQGHGHFGDRAPHVLHHEEHRGRGGPLEREMVGQRPHHNAPPLALQAGFQFGHAHGGGGVPPHIAHQRPPLGGGVERVPVGNR